MSTPEERNADVERKEEYPTSEDLKGALEAHSKGGDALLEFVRRKHMERTAEQDRLTAERHEREPHRKAT